MIDDHYNNTLNLEILFDQKRIYGDQRDFEVIAEFKRKNKPIILDTKEFKLNVNENHHCLSNWVIHIKSPRIAPQLAFSNSNLLSICGKCLTEAILIFETIRKNGIKI
jgi:hypothetical protein